WVHDQDEALAFYTDKLGLELRTDVTVPEMGNFRWLTVGVPGQEDVAITLMAVPGPPVFDPETQAQIKALMAKGAASGLFCATAGLSKGRGRAGRSAPTATPRRLRWAWRAAGPSRRQPSRRRRLRAPTPHSRPSRRAAGPGRRSP